MILMCNIQLDDVEKYMLDEISWLYPNDEIIKRLIAYKYAEDKAYIKNKSYVGIKQQATHDYYEKLNEKEDELFGFFNKED